MVVVCGIYEVVYGFGLVIDVVIEIDFCVV